MRQHPQTKRHRLGMKLFRIGVQAGATSTRIATALADLTAITGETSYVFALNGLEAMTIAKQECSQPMRISAEVGRRHTLQIGAACNCIWPICLRTRSTVCWATVRCRVAPRPRPMPPRSNANSLRFAVWDTI